MMPPSDLARVTFAAAFAAGRASAASTDPREELQGDLSYRERRLSERLRAEVARLNRQAARDLELRARFDEESA